MARIALFNSIELQGIGYAGAGMIICYGLSSLILLFENAKPQKLRRRDREQLTAWQYRHDRNTTAIKKERLSLARVHYFGVFCLLNRTIDNRCLLMAKNDILDREKGLFLSVY